MIGICGRCGNHDWDKTVQNGKIKCPKCGFEWEYKALPLFVLSGCSGIGKTTTAIEIMKKTTDIAVMDADIFCGVQNAQSEEDYRLRIDTIEGISKNVNQSGRPMLWTIAGNLDMLPSSYNSRFFSAIYCLALVADEQTVREHMTCGRGIVDTQWIQSSVEYNEYFKTHTSIGSLDFDILSIEGKTPEEAADEVISWVLNKLNKNTVDH
jgi:DNA-directed RNA polymerase subunit RPC12/RpoP